MHFDARAAKLLQPGQHLVVDGCVGLRLEASGTRRTWTYRYKAMDGRMKQIAIGHWPTMPVQAAVVAWQTLSTQRASGVDPRQARQQTRAAQVAAVAGPYTVRQLVADFVTGHLKVSRQADGALAAQRAMERVLDDDPAFAALHPHKVTRAVAFGVLDARKETPTAAAKLRSLFGGAWDYALDAGAIDTETPNHWRAVMRGRLKSKGKRVGGKHQGRKRRVLQAAEVGRLLAWLPNMHELGRDMTIMYLWTCTRGAEIVGLRPALVSQEPDGWWWTIPKAETKNANVEGAVDLRVPLIGAALRVVQRRLAKVGASGWLFEDMRGEQYQQKDFSTYIYSLQPYSVKVTGRASQGLVLPVSGWSPHNLRRTGRTLLAGLGCLDEIGEAILGHVPPGQVATYNAHTYDQERRYWLGKLSDFLEALPGVPALP